MVISTLLRFGRAQKARSLDTAFLPMRPMVTAVGSSKVRPTRWLIPLPFHRVVVGPQPHLVNMRATCSPSLDDYTNMGLGVARLFVWEGH